MWVGLGWAASACSRVVPPVSTSAESRPGAAGARDVDVEAVADAERAAVAEAVAARRRTSTASGLPTTCEAVRPARDLDRRQHGAGARPRAVGHREVGVAGGADQLGAADHGLGGELDLLVDEVVVAADDDDVGARWRSGCC